MHGRISLGTNGHLVSSPVEGCAMQDCFVNDVTYVRGARVHIIAFSTSDMNGITVEEILGTLPTVSLARHLRSRICSRHKVKQNIDNKF